MQILVKSIYPLPHFNFDPATNPLFYSSSYTTPTHPILMEIGLKRRKKGELTPEQRLAIIYPYKNGILQSKLADNFSYTRKTIYNTLKRFEDHKSI
jgi:DNA-binding MarR family transcriptional regulator